MTTNLFDKLTADKHLAAITSVSEMEPVTGPGSPVAAAVFAAESSKDPSSPAITENAVQRRVTDAGAEVVVDADGLPVRGSSVLIDSVFSQASRMESALWSHADYLGLPGIVFTTPSREDVESAVLGDKGAYATVQKSLKIDPSGLPEARTAQAAADLVYAELASITPEVSSWTLSHRGVDGMIRSSVLPDGSSVMDHPRYQALISASQRNIAPLLELSPNAALFGFWAAALPSGSKLSRSVAATVTGYDAVRVQEGTTKTSPVPMSAHIEVKDIDDADSLQLKPKPKTRPSNHGLGSVPSLGGHAVSCSTIISTASVSVGHLRRLLTASSLTPEQSSAALSALVGLGILGRTLVLEDGFYRSGCDLVDTRSLWSVVSRGGSSVIDSVPESSEDLLGEVKAAIEAAQKLGAFGTVEDRIEVTYSPSVLKMTAMSFCEQVLKGDEKEEA